MRLKLKWIAEDHDGFGSDQSKTMNVIDSKNAERDFRKKPVSTFLHPALVFLTALIMQVSTPATAGTLKIENAFTRPTLGGATVAVGYMTIVNTGKADDKLISVTSDIAMTAEIHESKMTGGVMQMGELPDGLTIPAGGSVTFKPGSYHLMFVGLKQAVKPGDIVHATLDFANAGEIVVAFPAADSFGATAPSGIGAGMNMNGMKMQ